jgi:hypothetical protein
MYGLYAYLMLLIYIRNECMAYFFCSSPIMALWPVPVSATLFRRAVLTLWHAFLFLGLKVGVPTRPLLVPATLTS